MRMDAINTGSGQRGKEKADDFFDYAADFPVAVVCILQVGLKTILYILSPHLKSVIRGILTPEGSLALWSACSNYLGVGTPSYYSLLLIITDKYINCKWTPETPYIVAFGSITELSEITV